MIVQLYLRNQAADSFLVSEATLGRTRIFCYLVTHVPIRLITGNTSPIPGNLFQIAKRFFSDAAADTSKIALLYTYVLNPGRKKFYKQRGENFSFEIA